MQVRSVKICTNSLVNPIESSEDLTIRGQFHQRVYAQLLRKEILKALKAA